VFSESVELQQGELAQPLVGMRQSRPIGCHGRTWISGRRRSPEAIAQFGSVAKPIPDSATLSRTFFLVCIFFHNRINAGSSARPPVDKATQIRVKAAYDGYEDSSIQRHGRA
jgi:hypothetical protein